MAVPINPFAVFDALAQSFPVPAPPAWLQAEATRRLLLWINHVLAQEPAALQRLVRQQGRLVSVQWRQIHVCIRITAAGMFELVEQDADPDLRLSLTQDSPMNLIECVVQGQKPAVRIDGDVQLAADIGWLMDHVRWDFEEDLARVMGDVHAHHLAQGIRALAHALGQWVRPGATPPFGPSA